MLASEVGLSLMGGFVAPFFAFYHHHRFKKEVAVTSSLSLMLAIVIIAHVFSNVVSMTASYALLTKFDDFESISVKQNQYATMLGFCSALLTTGLLNTIGTSAVFAHLVIVWSISTVLYLRR